MAYRKRRPGNKGKTCQRRQRVYVKGYGWAWRCKSYSKSGGKRSSSKRSGYRKGRRPFNKGKSCMEWGINSLGHVTCRSYGAVYGGKKKNRRRSRPNFSTVTMRSMPSSRYTSNTSRIPGSAYMPGYSSSGGVPSYMAL